MESLPSAPIKKGKNAFFCFEDDIHDSVQNPNKLYVPKARPTAKDFCDLIKTVFHIYNPMILKWTQNGKDFIESDHSTIEIPVEDRKCVVRISTQTEDTSGSNLSWDSTNDDTLDFTGASASMFSDLLGTEPQVALLLLFSNFSARQKRS